MFSVFPAPDSPLRTKIDVRLTENRKAAWFQPHWMAKIWNMGNDLTTTNNKNLAILYINQITRSTFSGEIIKLNSPFQNHFKAGVSTYVMSIDWSLASEK